MGLCPASPAQASIYFGAISRTSMTARFWLGPSASPKLNSLSSWSRKLIPPGKRC